jgi:hypothetical protein
MEYKLFKNIKDIPLYTKIKILIPKVKIALRQFLTSYFDGCTFQFEIPAVELPWISMDIP